MPIFITEKKKNHLMEGKEKKTMAGGANNAALDKAGERITAGKEAGDDYTQDLETIRNDLDADDDSGTTLGTMVQSQLKLTETETRYQVRAGVPTKATKAVKAAADEVKKS